MTKEAGKPSVSEEDGVSALDEIPVMVPVAKKLRTESAPPATNQNSSSVEVPALARKSRVASAHVVQEGSSKEVSERPVDKNAEALRGPVVSEGAKKGEGTLRKLNVSSRCFVCQKKLQLKNDGDNHETCQVCSVENGTIVHGMKGQTAVSIRSITFCGQCMKLDTTRKALQESLDLINKKMVTDKILSDVGDRKPPCLDDFKVNSANGSLKIYVCVRIGGCWNRIRRSHDLTSWRVPQPIRQEDNEKVNPSSWSGSPGSTPGGFMGPSVGMRYPQGMTMPVFSGMNMQYPNQQFPTVNAGAVGQSQVQNPLLVAQYMNQVQNAQLQAMAMQVSPQQPAAGATIGAAGPMNPMLMQQAMIDQQRMATMSPFAQQSASVPSPFGLGAQQPGFPMQFLMGGAQGNQRQGQSSFSNRPS